MRERERERERVRGREGRRERERERRGGERKFSERASLCLLEQKREIFLST